MKKHDVVKFKDPVDDNEAKSRFVLLEDPDMPRVLVKEICDMPLPRTTIFNVDELVVCDMTSEEEVETARLLVHIAEKYKNGIF